MLQDTFGDKYHEVKGKMKEYWNEDNTDVRTYFEQLDARVAELFHEGGSADMINF